MSIFINNYVITIQVIQPKEVSMRIKKEKKDLTDTLVSILVSSGLDEDKTSIVTYQNHLISQMEDMKVMVRY